MKASSAASVSNPDQVLSASKSSTIRNHSQRSSCSSNSSDGDIDNDIVSILSNENSSGCLESKKRYRSGAVITQLESHSNVDNISNMSNSDSDSNSDSSDDDIKSIISDEISDSK